jgi:hypothetical protein
LCVDAFAASPAPDADDDADDDAESEDAELASAPPDADVDPAEPPLVDDDDDEDETGLSDEEELELLASPLPSPLELRSYNCRPYRAAMAPAATVKPATRTVLSRAAVACSSRRIGDNNDLVANKIGCIILLYILPLFLFARKKKDSDTQAGGIRY